MSPEEEAAVCRAKVHYDTAKSAHDVRRRLLKKRRRRETYVYKCRVCAGYHIAKVPKPIRGEKGQAE